MVLEEIRNDVISFLQELVLEANLPLEICRIQDDILAPLSAELNWDWALAHLNEEHHFDLAIGIKLNDDVDGMAVGLYCTEREILELQAIESFVRLNEDHPLKGRMILLTIIAATYFVLQVEGYGVNVLDPDSDLISYYEKFNLIQSEDPDGKVFMSGTVEVLSEKLSEMVETLRV